MKKEIEFYFSNYPKKEIVEITDMTYCEIMDMVYMRILRGCYEGFYIENGNTKFVLNLNDYSPIKPILLKNRINQ